MIRPAKVITPNCRVSVTATERSPPKAVYIAANTAIPPTKPQAAESDHPLTIDRVRKAAVAISPNTSVRYCTWTKAHITRAATPKRASRYSALVYIPARYIGSIIKKAPNPQPPTTPTQFMIITPIPRV